VKRALGLLPYAVFLLLAAISWNRWLEPYVDSGRELMAPWRIAGGEALYRDVRFYHGPLGPYLAAGVELLLPRSLPARFFLAALIAVAHIEALRRLARRLLSPDRAALTVALIVAVAFFLRPGGCYFFPFSLDTAIAVTAIAWALYWAGSGSPRSPWLAGAALTAALLSRPELGLAAVAAILLDRESGSRRARRAIPLAAAPLAVATAAYALVSAGTPLRTLRAEGWLAFLKPPAEFRNVYAAYAGLDAPGLRLAELLLAAAVLAVLAGLLWLAARVSATRGHGATLAAVLLLLLLAAGLRWRPPAGLAETLALFPPLIRVVPPLVLAALAARLVRRFLGGQDRGLFAGLPTGLLLVAGLFSLRTLLVAGYFGPYNAFLLPLPLLCAATGLFGVVDRLAGKAAPRLPALAAVALTVFLLFRVASLADLYRHPSWSSVATPAGSVALIEPVAATTRLTLEDLLRRVPAGGTLTGFPEAGFLNYALGLRNPLPQDQFFPGHLGAEEESETIRRLGASPPHALVYVNVLAVGHRSPVFGRDYLHELDRFARARFAPAASYGPAAGPNPLIGDPNFFIQIRVP
jgi:hypothetical protein